MESLSHVPIFSDKINYVFEKFTRYQWFHQRHMHKFLFFEIKTSISILNSSRKESEGFYKNYSS